MGFKTLQPEFAYMNYLDNAVYSIQSTVTITSNFSNESYLYDNDSSKQAEVTTPSYPEVVEVDFGQLRTMSLVKLLNHNLEDFLIEVFDGNDWSTYTDDAGVQASFSTYTNDYYSGYRSPGEGSLLVTHAGDFLLTTSGILGVDTNAKFSKIRLTINSTQDGSEPKIGEFYAGARAVKFDIGKVLDFDETAVDFRRNVLSSWRGKAFSTRSVGTYGAQMIFRVTDYDEYTFLETFTKDGGLYTFFPTSTLYGETISPSFSHNDIYLVQSVSDWRAKPWGLSAKQQITIKLLESDYVPNS